MKLQSVTRTVNPDGTVISYQYGMPKPEPKCFGHIMKQTVFNLITRRRRNEA